MGASTKTSQIVPRTKAAKREAFDLPLIPPRVEVPADALAEVLRLAAGRPEALRDGGYHMPSWVPSMEPNPLNLTRRMARRMPMKPRTVAMALA